MRHQIDSSAAAPRPGGRGAVIHALSAELAAISRLAEIERRSSRLPWSERLFAEEFENHFSQVFGASSGEDLIGFLVAHVVLDEVHVVNLAVEPAWRGRGVGRQLLATVLLRLYYEGVRWAYLEARESNHVALTLYLSLGFYRVAVRPGYYSDNGESAVLLNLDLERLAASHREGRRAAG